MWQDQLCLLRELGIQESGLKAAWPQRRTLFLSELDIVGVWLKVKGEVMSEIYFIQRTIF